MVELLALYVLCCEYQLAFVEQLNFQCKGSHRLLEPRQSSALHKEAGFDNYLSGIDQDEQ